MEKRVAIIKQYFQSWLTQDISKLRLIFADEIEYVECYGPIYQGIEQLCLWFEKWNKHGRVLQWDIKQIIHQDNITVVEWYFKCEYDNNISAFDGVSIITFNDEDKIISLKEFESKCEHVYPYCEEK